jgi:molybdopterin-guanine dinucleotide biosynthesis protein A
MPFLNPRLLDFLARLAPGFDVVVPVLGVHLEPLHAVYSRNCLKPIQTLLQKGNMKVIDLFPQVRVRRVTGDEIDVPDLRHWSFFNVNTEEDLDLARSRISPETVVPYERNCHD